MSSDVVIVGVEEDQDVVFLHKSAPTKRPVNSQDDVIIVGGSSPKQRCRDKDTLHTDSDPALSSSPIIVSVKPAPNGNPSMSTVTSILSSFDNTVTANPDTLTPSSTHTPTLDTHTPTTPSRVDNRLPKCWTECPACQPTQQRRYHLITVTPRCSEWSFVSDPLTRVEFTVRKVQRIQNMLLWERLCVEKGLMLRQRPDVNMQLLYHTSSANPAIICDEGLDNRLSRHGNFGRGIYFSDNPAKCDCYSSMTGVRKMFLCRVLLGDIKVYPESKVDTHLVREPLKEYPKPGEPKTYDSVKGCLGGLNEYVVYNAYRVMPEYLIEYTVGPLDQRECRAVTHSRGTNTLPQYSRRKPPRRGRTKSTKY